MKKTLPLAFILVAPLIGAAPTQPPETPKKQEQPAQPEMPPLPPPPGEHHKWLEQFVGTWTVESEMLTGEGAPPMKCTGTDTVRSIGGRWIVGDLRSEVPGMGPMHAVYTIGYNAETGKYQGTWIDSVSDMMWIYEGTVDPTGKILTLEAEGPNMMDPTQGKTKFRDVFEFKSADHRVLTSSALMNGQWVQFATANYRKTK